MFRAATFILRLAEGGGTGGAWLFRGTLRLAGGGGITGALLSRGMLGMGGGALEIDEA